jgi:adenosylmethionine-8-amino-7-oxononanoate aminotransferase
MLNDWPKAPAAYPYRCRFCDSTEECRDHGVECAKELEQVIRDTGPEYVSAFIVEPVVGAANAAAVPGEDYFQTVREICDKYDVLLIADEVMSGMGRTGENFAIEHWDVLPDIITSAKGLSAGYAPVGGTFPRNHIAEVFAEKEDGFTHGHTFCFSPTTSAIGSAVLKYVDDHDVMDNARKVGTYTRDRFDEFYDYEFVGDVRGKGLMLGLEFVEDPETKEPLTHGGAAIRDYLFDVGLENGIITYPGGGTVDGERGDHLLITPPLNISREEADEMMSRLHDTLEAVSESKYITH